MINNLHEIDINKIQKSTTNDIRQILFAQDYIKNLKEHDFDLDSKNLITIKHNDCMFVLFYNNSIDNKLIKIWSLASQLVVGPIFCACNLTHEKKVFDAFTKLRPDNNSLHWAHLKDIPFILVYHNGWPISFYNGEYAIQSIIDYGD